MNDHIHFKLILRVFFLFPVQRHLDKIRYIRSPLKIRNNYMFDSNEIISGALQVFSLLRTSPELHGDSFREDHV